ncbi:MAG: hypothetical protein Q9209_006545 [Squamulea sp. 1 TL-2023]
MFKVVSPKTVKSVSDLQQIPPQCGPSTVDQMLSASGEPSTATAEDLLVVSPYTSRPHLLNLNLLDHAQNLLAKALTILAPITDAYATSSYISSFNWVAVFSLLAASAKAEGYTWRKQFFYVIIFRSQVPSSTNRSDLAALDIKAHAEAMQSGGLLKYWFGTPDAEGRNLATCIWRRREDAQPGSSGEGHKAAMRATINMYSEWQVERLKLIVGDNVENWDIIAWTN